MPGPPGSTVVITGKRKKGKHPPLAAAAGKHADPQKGCSSGPSGTPPCPAPNQARPSHDSLIPVPYISLCEAYSRLSGLNRSSEMAPHEGKRGGKQQKPNTAFTSRFLFPPNVRGLVNSSQFCFMNSMLQCLLFVPPFAQLAVAAVTEPVCCPTLSALGKWMQLYWRTQGRSSVVPPRLPFTTRHGPTSGVTNVDGHVQEDAQEFLQRMLETIDAELLAFEHHLQLNESVTEKDYLSISGVSSPRAPSEVSTIGPSSTAASMKGWTVVRGKEKLSVRHQSERDETSILLSHILGGTVESHLAGKNKQRDRASVVVEKFFSLPIDCGFKMECTIEEAIERTMTTERIYDGERDRELKKTLSFGSLPQLLFLHLRRWAITAEGELVKLDNMVKYGRSLVIPKSVCSTEIPASQRNYQLVATVVHRGNSAGQGHYVTYLCTQATVVDGTSSAASAEDRPSHRPVVLCNDARISLASYDDMMKEPGYFLVYQRV